MERQISELLQLTFTGGNSEIIKNAENKLLQGVHEPSFFQSLFNLIINPQTLFEIKKSALVFLNTVILKMWNQIDDNIKNMIIQFIINFLVDSPPQLFKYLSYLTRNLVLSSFDSINWLNSLNTLSSDFQDEKNIIRFLVIANAICISFERKNADQNTLLQFVPPLMSLLINLIGSCQNIATKSLCFKCLAHIFNFKEIINNDFIASIQNLINSTVNIKDYINNLESEPYIINVIKFLIKCNSYIDVNTIKELILIIQQILASPLSIKLKCKSLLLLYQFYRNANFWSFIKDRESDYINLLITMIFPIFSISEEDVQNMQDDPYYFISENQKICDDFNDLKASSSLILYNVAKNHPVLISFCLSSINDIYIRYTNNQASWMDLFSLFHMVSSVVNLATKKNSNEVIQVFNNILPLFSLPSSPGYNCFATASAFMLLSNVQNIKYTKELIGAVFLHIDNPFTLIRLYTIECISSVLRQISKDNEIKQEIFSSFGEKIRESLQILIEMSSLGVNSSITESFLHYFSVFGETLLPISHDLSQHFLNMINSICDSHNDSESFSALYMAIESLSTLMKIVFKSEEISNKECPFVYHSLLQLIPKIPMTLTDAYFSLLNQLILQSSFNSSYWEDTIAIYKLYKESNFDGNIDGNFSILFESLMFKDINMTNNSTIQFIQEYINNMLHSNNQAYQHSIDGFVSICPSLTGFILRVCTIGNQNSDIIQAILHKVIEAIQYYCNNPNEYPPHSLVNLLNAFLIVVPESFSYIESSIFQTILFFWSSYPQYPMTILATLKIFQQLNNEQKSSILQIILDLLYEKLELNMLKASEEDEDSDFDDDSDIESDNEKCLWFSDEFVISSAIELFIENQNSPFLGNCDENKLSLVISHRYQK